MHQTESQKTLERLHGQIRGLLDWGHHLTEVRQAHGFLMSHVPPAPLAGDVPQATIDAAQRVLDVLQAFKGLPYDDHQILADVVNDPWRGPVPAWANRPLHGQALARIWQSCPILADLQADMDAAEEQVAEAARQAAAKFEANRLPREKRVADAPSILLDLHHAGLRLALAEDGKVHVFPASCVTPDQRALLIAYAAELPAAILAETVAM